MTTEQTLLALLSLVPLALVLCFRRSIAVRVLCVLGVALFVHLEMVVIPGAASRAAMRREESTSPEYREAVEYTRDTISKGEMVLGWYVIALAAIALIPVKRKNNRSQQPPSGYSGQALEPEA